MRKLKLLMVVLALTLTAVLLVGCVDDDVITEMQAEIDTLQAQVAKFEKAEADKTAFRNYLETKENWEYYSFTRELHVAEIWQLSDTLFKTYVTYKFDGGIILHQYLYFEKQDDGTYTYLYEAEALQKLTTQNQN